VGHDEQRVGVRRGEAQLGEERGDPVVDVRAGLAVGQPVEEVAEDVAFLAVAA